MTPQDKKEFEPLTEDVPLPRMFEAQEQKNFPELLIILAKRKRFILFFVAGVFGLSVAISLLLPVYYTSTVKIMPPQQSPSTASTMLDQLGGLSTLLGNGVSKDLLKNPSDLYVDLLRSRTIADVLIDRFNLMSVYKKALRVDCRHRLDELTEVRTFKDGVISVSVDDQGQQRAAEIANAYIEELDKLTRTLAVTDASKRRVFFEREAKTANEELAAAEQALKQTEEKTGIIQLDSQSKVELQAYEDLRAQATALEVQIQAMGSFATPNNPDLVRSQQELAALRTQIARFEKGQGGSPVGDIALEKVPEKALEYVQKLREVKYRESLLQLMLKQYEIARIDEAKDASLIEFLDRAIPAERKSWPVRSVIVIIATVLAIIVAGLWAYAAEAAERAKEDPHYLARLQLLKFYLTRKRKSQVFGA